jgi:hypothetical protein
MASGSVRPQWVLRRDGRVGRGHPPRSHKQGAREEKFSESPKFYKVCWVPVTDHCRTFALIRCLHTAPAPAWLTSEGPAWGLSGQYSEQESQWGALRVLPLSPAPEGSEILHLTSRSLNSPFFLVPHLKLPSFLSLPYSNGLLSLWTLFLPLSYSVSSKGQRPWLSQRSWEMRNP